MRRWWQAALITLLGCGLAGSGLAGCAIANAPPSPGRLPSAHHTILAIGDSLMGQNDFALPGVLAAQGIDATLIDAHVNGSGLIGPVGDRPSALSWVQHQVEAHPEVDTVIIEWAGACALCGKTGYPTYGSTTFLATWRTNALAILDYLHARGLPVIWVHSPPVGASSDTVASGSQINVATTLQLCNIEQAEFAPYASSVTTDWYVALTDVYHQYQTNLYYDAAWHQVRADDLVHLTIDGATRTALWTARGLSDLWQATPPPDVPHTLENGPRLIQAGDAVSLDVGTGL